MACNQEKTLPSFHLTRGTMYELSYLITVLISFSYQCKFRRGLGRQALQVGEVKGEVAVFSAKRWDRRSS